MVKTLVRWTIACSVMGAHLLKMGSIIFLRDIKHSPGDRFNENWLFRVWGLTTLVKSC